MLDKNITIAIDGPAGAGKSTIAKKVAEALSIEYVDTGAMYRALTLKVLRLGVDPLSENNVIDVLKNTSIDFKGNHIYLDDIQVDDKIRDSLINKNVSFVAQIKEVREGMVKIQQGLAKTKSIIMDGRDIGTVVLPNAEFKFFITASVEERASRRYKELVEKGEKGISYEQVKFDIENRDRIDSTREVAPLVECKDAYRIDTTNKTIEQSVKEVISIVKGR
ncbi:(d)CMP kinase [Tissierella praeacuta]|uniref:Cytidylate kinase n=1 Tax=Tissierella praeacuta DSM 18095 TaxID=1123404 RepID=A0A1M4SFT3_9FIRM|nr:(d)CMP kinase [Tissierella praeacuta]TCU72739.1 cytidylate kinase [Tissierella praeacuta]SHE31049.1 cytidylate kinase [Tissierella praeacuta DSM 18095]SUP01384.1 Cytidylate kinase [Tissierella praeacuta]HAE92735.1 (d)CMP kinase [Tissierella sp.]